MSLERLQRWRMVLGKEAHQPLAATSGMTDFLTREQQELDEALAALYEGTDARQGDSASDGEDDDDSNRRRSAGLGDSAPRLAKWLGDIRSYFPRDIVAVIQRDAIERKGLTELLFEPETLSRLTPNVELVSTLLSLKEQIPDNTKESAREVIRGIVEEISRKMKGSLEQAVRGSVDRSRHSPIRCLPNLDWNRTIRRNLKNYHPELKTIIPDTFHFYAQQQRRKEWNVIVCMDQSGSMADSVVYGSIIGCILAMLPALETHVIVFDTEVVDLTDKCHDPVDLLFGVQLGGGTDINRAVGYCQQLIQQPRKTILFLITDLYEGGDAKELLRRVTEITASGVRMICLLALCDSGVPCYDGNLARQMNDRGVPTFGCTPKMLPTLLEGALKGHDLLELAKSCGIHPVRK